MMRKNLGSMPKRLTSSQIPKKKSMSVENARSSDSKLPRNRPRRTSTIGPTVHMRESFEKVVFQQFTMKKRDEFLELAKEHKMLVSRLQENEEKLLSASAKLIIWNHRYKTKKKKQ